MEMEVEIDGVDLVLLADVVRDAAEAREQKALNFENQGKMRLATANAEAATALRNMHTFLVKADKVVCHG
jgi:hypothetical protein